MFKKIHEATKKLIKFTFGGKFIELLECFCLCRFIKSAQISSYDKNKIESKRVILNLIAYIVNGSVNDQLPCTAWQINLSSQRDKPNY